MLIKENSEEGTTANEYDFITGPVPNYDGALVKGGNGRYGAYRTSQNSIMRFYLFINKQEWKNGWDPVQQFYIKYFINNI